MDVQTFVDQMNNVIVPVNKRDALNYSEEYLDKYKNAYKLSPLGKKSESNNQLLKLLFEYDCKIRTTLYKVYQDILIESLAYCEGSTFSVSKNAAFCSKKGRILT